MQHSQRTTLLLLLLLAVHLMTHAADMTLRGTAVDAATGEPLAFATIKAYPGQTATHADADGVWSLRVPQGTSKITATYIPPPHTGKTPPAPLPSR